MSQDLFFHLFGPWAALGIVVSVVWSSGTQMTPPRTRVAHLRHADLRPVALFTDCCAVGLRTGAKAEILFVDDQCWGNLNPLN